MGEILALDIGGTTVKVGRVGPDLGLRGEVVVRPIRSSGSAEAIEEDLRSAVGAAMRGDVPVEGVGVALPDPADYLTGTLWMEHKLAALKGRSLVPLLGGRDRPVAFVNDAEAFALGEAVRGAGQGGGRLLAVTLGTGFGSAFLDGLEALSTGPGVPPLGRLWNQPFAEGPETIEARLGRAALEACYVALGGEAGVSLAEAAERARRGEAAALALFAELAVRLAQGLASPVRAFRPDRIVVGGAVAQSHALFLPAAEVALAEALGHRVPLLPSALGRGAALTGAAWVLGERRKRFARRRTIYLHGFASSPGSTKAVRFAEAFASLGAELEVPDLNEGSFTELTLSRQLALLDRLTQGAPDGSVLLVGSSLGAYAAALFAARSRRVAALVLMAPAFEFLDRWAARLGPETLAEWKRAGTVEVMHHAYGRPLPIGYALMEDARRHAAYPDVRVPTLVLHGRHDETVDAEVSSRFAAERPNVELVLLDADHSLGAVLPELVRRAIAFLEPWLG